MKFLIFYYNCIRLKQNLRNNVFKIKNVLTVRYIFLFLAIIIPAILAAHVWVMNARAGTEKSMSIGQEHMLLLSSVALPAFDYVALGHIHKGQVLNEQPPNV